MDDTPPGSCTFLSNKLLHSQVVQAGKKSDTQLPNGLSHSSPYMDVCVVQAGEIMRLSRAYGTCRSLAGKGDIGDRGKVTSGLTLEQ